MIKEGRTPDAKVVVIGDSGVGKSSITARYVFDKFDLNQEPTLGAAYMEKVCAYDNGTKTIKLQIWDTAGQEKYLAIAKLYYRDCRVAILVYDITRPASFQNLRKWAEQVGKHAPKTVVKMVIGNKSDLIGEIDTEFVPEYEGRKYAEEIGASFAMVSAKDNKMITEVFSKITQQVAPQVAKIHQRKSQTKRSILESQEINRKKRCC